MTTSFSAAPAPATTTDEIALFGALGDDPGAVATATLITTMLDSGKGISDLIFSPGRPPQVEKHGDLTPVEIPELPMLHADRHCPRRSRSDRRESTGAADR